MSRAVLAAVFVVLVGLYFATRLWHKHSGRIQFVPDLDELGWRERTKGQIEVRISGRMTYDGPSMLHVLQIFLDGTEPIDFFADITPEECATTFNLKELFLDKHPRKVVASLMLRSPVVRPGETLKRQLIFREHGGGEFNAGPPLEFPYNSALHTVNTDGTMRPAPNPR